MEAQGSTPRLPRGRPSLGACPTLTVLLRRTIRDRLRRSRPRKTLNVFQRIHLRFSGPCAAHLAAPPAPRHEDNAGQVPRVWISCGIPWQRVNCFECCGSSISGVARVRWGGGDPDVGVPGARPSIECRSACRNRDLSLWLMRRNSNHRRLKPGRISQSMNSIFSARQTRGTRLH